MLSTTPSGTVNSVDHFKALRTALIAILAVFLESGLSAVIAAIQGGTLSLGGLSIFATLIVGVLGYLLDLIRRYFTNYSA